MSSVTHLEPPTDAPVSFGRSADGMNVALVGEAAFAMAPARDGRHILVTAWNIRRPMEGWTRNDFYGHCGDLADEAAFRARVLETAEHRRDLAVLQRIQTRMACSTPWGASQLATIYAEGIVAHMTAGHGGFRLSAERNAKVMPPLRIDSGWYEEDDAWAIVALTFPDLFTSYERKLADRTIRDKWPDEWEAIHGRRLEPGESAGKDRRDFERRHADDWIVVSAINSSHQPGMVEVVAVLGARQVANAQERRILLPTAEYQARGPIGFVIDEARHCSYDGPSSFVGWQPRKAS